MVHVCFLKLWRGLTSVALAVAIVGFAFGALVFAGFQWLLMKDRWLIVLLAAIAIALANSSCSTPPAADPRDPEIFRPVNPRYPMP